MDFAIDAGFADPPRDQLGDLGAEIDDQDAIRHGSASYTQLGQKGKLFRGRSPNRAKGPARASARRAPWRVSQERGCVRPALEGQSNTEEEKANISGAEANILASFSPSTPARNRLTR